MSAKALVTVEEFARMRFADTEDYELVDGELIRLPSGTLRHGLIRGCLESALRAYFKERRTGGVFAAILCLVAPDRIRRPDIAVYAGARLNQIDLDTIPAALSPDIAVEVLSPSEGSIEMRAKVREYLHAGSAEVWLVDPSNREVQIHVPDAIRILGETATLETPALPEFRIEVAALFAV